MKKHIDPRTISLNGLTKEKKLKVTMLERYFFIEKDVILLNETKLDVTFNKCDLARSEIIRLNQLIENFALKANQSIILQTVDP